ncbi:hypothetical protein V1281_004835 [Nitrobacteraceae bacterium AZCC 2161]
MQTLHDIRAARPSFYPDQSIYAEYACQTLGLDFAEIDAGTGLVFIVSSPGKTVCFGAGRCSFFPQNNATAATLANDKYFSNVVLEKSGVATLGGRYFFLHDRYRAHRAPGHERADALSYFRNLDGSAFVKPLTGSRGDFAQPITGADSLSTYLDEVSRYYDAVLMQPIFSGQEYRIFLLDDDVIYSARKTPPSLLGDGIHSIRALLAADDAALHSHGISSATASTVADALDRVLPKGERWAIPGRMNRSAGGTMSFESPNDKQAAFAMAKRAAKALGLRAAAVDVFTDIGGDPAAMRVIEVNANPSIRFLEDSGRSDLILKIWRHTFSAIGLLDV